MKQIDISIVVPVYNESKNIRPFLQEIEKVVEKIGTYEILFCLDPCTDDTESVIKDEMGKNPNIGLMVFSRRFGQPAATIAGIRNCRGDACVVIDVDLQDPPEIILELYNKYREGYDVVLAQRTDRDGETVIKKIISHFGYKLINKIADVNIPQNTGDFRIISRRFIEELRLLKESHGFLRGLSSYVGFKQAIVRYRRKKRFSGTGNYNRFTGSLKIGFNGIIGFSTAPLSMLLWLGFFVLSIATLAIIYIFISKFILHSSYPIGIPTIITLILFMGGLNMMMLGIIGEYIGRIYEEVRQRPQYIIADHFNVSLQDNHGLGSNKSS